MRSTPRDPERFSKVAAGVQSWVTTAAIVVGGAWVLYTFWALGSTHKSRAEIAELEQRAIEQPVLTAKIGATVFTGSAYAQPFISVEVDVRNAGKLALEFHDPIVQIARLTPDGAGLVIERFTSRPKGDAYQ